MTHKLVLHQYIDLPFHAQGDFDHGDVSLSNGSVFIANTAAGTVEVVDGEGLRHLVTIPGCPEASGVLAAQKEGLVLAAARGAGKLLVIDAVSTTVIRTVAVGSRPNGLGWDPRRKHLLVADVQDNTARLVDPRAGQVIATASLPGRPRWAVYDRAGDRFLVNIREPPMVAVLSASTFALVGQFPVSDVGPHGLDLDQEGRRAFVACDGGSVVTLDTSTGSELAKVPIAGAPDVIWHNYLTSHLYVAIEDPGVIDVLNTQTMAVDEQIQTEPGAHTTAFDALRQRLYVFLPSCRVAVYEESEVG
ncbi:MAG: YncE family protein [Ktedonobacteraceae bacterium]